tara:strand:+ start:144 stop:1859 length:1716 start_codon:yes stop_codon:yes gene_type:complete
LNKKYDLIGRLRLYSGAILYVYVVMHLLNHALGLISLEAMEWGRGPFLMLWRNPVGTTLLTASLGIHAGLSLYTLYRRRTLKMPLHEAVQVVGGLLLPPLLASHIIGSRLLHEKFGVNDTYTWVLLNMWVLDPKIAVQQILALAVAWTHGTLGLRRVLILKPWFEAWRPLMFTTSILIPTLSLLGFIQGGREVALLSQSPTWFAEIRDVINWPTDDAINWHGEMLDVALGGMATLLVLVLATRMGRSLWHKRMGLVSILYPEGQKTSIVKGMSILEASRAANIPHASVCGGRGRCSTCRVKIDFYDGELPRQNEDETRVLQRVGAPAGVRLACQLRPQADMQITPLLPPTATRKDALNRANYLIGEERDIVIMFADLRAFTRLSEDRLPYDIVFILNQYFHLMGKAIEDTGGRVDKFIGDGIMALFGIESGPTQGCREALRAAEKMDRALSELNQTLRHQITEPLSMGMGIHSGTAIIGEMGYGKDMSLTAIGDTVNIAAKLENATRDFQCRLIVSHNVCQQAGVDLSRFPSMGIMIPGKTNPIPAYLVSGALDDLFLHSPPATFNSDTQT